ncbi:hypothetical protein [Fusobacterium polymorphum]|uniref:hypothetical protein n=1 Tax=Fusobacterium nucleatum subsp. polymorphum TaxID=76857 RepID=UPI0030081B20
MNEKQEGHHNEVPWYENKWIIGTIAIVGVTYIGYKILTRNRVDLRNSDLRDFMKGANIPWWKIKI